MNCEDVNDFINLKLVMFVMAVCHVVLVVENCFTDPNVHRYWHIATVSVLQAMYCSTTTAAGIYLFMP